MAIAKGIILKILLLVAFLVPECSNPVPVIIFCSPDSPQTRQVIAGLEAKLGLGSLRVIAVPEIGEEGPTQLRQVRQIHPRLLLVMGTAALRWAAPVEKQIPIVFAMVADPFFTGAVYDPAHPEIHQENITGIASPSPLGQALQHGVSLLGGGRWGLLYDPTDGAAVEQAHLFQQKAYYHGIEPLIEASAEAASDRQALDRLIRHGVRVIYLPAAGSADRYSALVLKYGTELKVRVVSSYPAGSHQGATLWVAINYRRVGEEAGELAARVLQGTRPAKIPITVSTPMQVEVDDHLVQEWSGYPPSSTGEKRGKE